MKLITWNCNMAFRKKAEFILACNPDILVIPECENPKKLIFKDSIQPANEIIWFGNNNDKGLGVFSYNGYKLSLLEIYNPDIKIVIPILITSENITFTLFAIWANNPTDNDGRYIEQIGKAIEYYDSLIQDNQVILMGDFNSNMIWDKKHRYFNHSKMVKVLESKNIYSLYHSFYKIEHGKEIHPTLYMYRHKQKPYHIDYCFVSQKLAEKLQTVEIGDFDQWIKYSDHTPVIVDFDIN